MKPLRRLKVGDVTDAVQRRRPGAGDLSGNRPPQHGIVPRQRQELLLHPGLAGHGPVRRADDEKRLCPDVPELVTDRVGLLVPFKGDGERRRLFRPDCQRGGQPAEQRSAKGNRDCGATGVHFCCSLFRLPPFLA